LDWWEGLQARIENRASVLQGSLGDLSLLLGASLLFGY
jgi:hypothetical protein